MNRKDVERTAEGKETISNRKTILKNCRRRLTNLYMAWTDYRKAYGMAPYSWSFKCARMVRVAQNIITLIENSMANWQKKKKFSLVYFLISLVYFVLLLLQISIFTFIYISLIFLCHF